MTWQPIETSPKDGSVTILFSAMDGVVCVGVFDYCLWHCIASGDKCHGGIGFEAFADNEPTHWMPLPDPPKAKGIEG